MDLCKQNFAPECEAGINRQINKELYAFYTYTSLAFYFERDDVDLKGFAKFFRDSAKEELEHAEKFMKFQTERGGRIVLQDIKRPDKDEWGTGLDAMETALALEKTVNQALLDLKTTSDEHGDHQMSDFIEEEFLGEQVASIRKLAGYITNLKRVGTGQGEYLFDHETLGD
ncbi:hypothetical protein EMCRGX_G002657 [Ephydatia muelleri]|eukprot:Em0055g11a